MIKKGCTDCKINWSWADQVIKKWLKESIVKK